MIIFNINLFCHRFVSIHSIRPIKCRAIKCRRTQRRCWWKTNWQTDKCL